MEKTLFIFKNNTPTAFEIIAESQGEAIQKVKELMGKEDVGYLQLQLITQNYSCPRCGCHASECNL